MPERIANAPIALLTTKRSVLLDTSAGRYERHIRFKGRVTGNISLPGGVEYGYSPAALLIATGEGIIIDPSSEGHIRHIKLESKRA